MLYAARAVRLIEAHDFKRAKLFLYLPFQVPSRHATPQPAAAATAAAATPPPARCRRDSRRPAHPLPWARAPAPLTKPRAAGRGVRYAGGARARPGARALRGSLPLRQREAQYFRRHARLPGRGRASASFPSNITREIPLLPF